MPFIDKVVIFINGGSGLIAIFLVSFSSLFTVLTIAEADFEEIKYLDEHVSIGKGVITSIFESNLSINGESVLGYDYTFFSPNGEMKWTSYHLGLVYEIGDSVEIEYSPVRPDVNRIKGMNNTPGGWMAAIILLPLIGSVIWLVYSIWKGMFRLRLLRIGYFANARLERKESTMFKVNNKRVYRFVFSFLDNWGNENVVTAKTSNPEKFEPLENVIAVYDPGNPRHAFILDSLPARTWFYIKKDWLKM